MKRLLCVWLPNWPIQRVQIEKQPDGEPDSATGPILLWNEDPRRGRLVAACCQRAQRLGVRVQMPIAQAGEMVRTSDVHPSVQSQDRHLDNESLKRIADRLAKRITPLIAIETLDDKPWADHPRHQCESLLGDITGAAHLFDGEIGLLAAADQLLAEMGLNARIAIADSSGAAWAMAHYARDTMSIAAQQAESPGQPTADDFDRNTATNLFLSPAGTSRQYLAPLPVQSLRISPDNVATLKRLGVSHVDQLLQLPRSGLAPRLGHHLVRRIEQALGEIDEPLRIHHAPVEDLATLELEYATSDQRILADRIEKLTKKIRAGLATRQRGALRVACRLDLSDHPPLIFEIGLFAPTIDVDHLSGLMINRLESKKLPSRVQRIAVSVTLSGPLRSSQTSLFDAGDNEVDSYTSGSAISRLVDSLSGRLGRDAVLRVHLEEDPLPEKAFRVSPLTGNHLPSARSASSRPVRVSKPAFGSPVSSSHFVSSARIDHSKRRSQQHFHAPQGASFVPSPDDAMRRPLSLHAEPIPLAVAFGNGSFCRGVGSPRLPNRLRLKGQVHQITRHWGPERIETGWWKGPSIGRDYYRIETDHGQWWWIFRNLLSKTQAPDASTRFRWMLHGRFA